MSPLDEEPFEESKLRVIEAFEIEMLEGDEPALRFLGPPTDPVLLRAQLLILLRSSRYEDAKVLVEGRKPAKEWLELGAHVASYWGDLERTREFIRLAALELDSSILRRARVASAEGLVAHIRSITRPDSILSVHRWSDEIVERCQVVYLEFLEPILSLIRTKRGFRGDIELSALEHIILLSHILKQDRLQEEVIGILIKSTPIPILVAELVLEKHSIIAPEIVQRVRLEHIGNFRANLLAAIIEREVLERPVEAMDKLLKMSESELSDIESETLANTILETIGQCDVDTIGNASDVISKLVPEDVRMANYFKLFAALAAGEPKQAQSLLNEIPPEDDAVWWQAQAYIHEREGRDEDAEQAWSEAAELLPVPQILRKTVQLSLQNRRFKAAVRNLERLLATGDSTDEDKRNLAFAYMRIGSFSSAIAPLQELHERKNEGLDTTVALAQCYLRTGDLKQAIEVLEGISAESGEVRLRLFLSELYTTANRPEDSFKTLDEISSDHWDDPTFVVSYMHRAYAAAREDEANRAFVRLCHLKNSGSLSDDFMKTATLEEIIQFSKARCDSRDELYNMVAEGRLPWLFADDLLGIPPHWAWNSRTQELSWLAEEKLACATRSIYATNGFANIRTEGAVCLERISCSDQETSIVIDLSALITLHELGLLSTVVDHFDSIILPSKYLELQGRDATRFGQHQPSREIELKEISKRVDIRQINVCSAEDAFEVVDEFGDLFEGTRYSIADMVAAIAKAQKGRKEEWDSLLQVSQIPRRQDEQFCLKLGSPIRIELTTLRAIARRHGFDLLAREFSIHISNNDWNQLKSELVSHEAARAVRKSSDEMWELVRKLTLATKISFRSNEEDRDDHSVDQFLPQLHADSIGLSSMLNVPLLCDDRVNQVQRFNEEGSLSYTAFGTEQLILSLYRQQKISAEKKSNCLLQLMRWRYKFLVMNGETLKGFADMAQKQLPGDALLEVSAYLHRCLADPGLFCGFENTEPPMPMAIKFATAWADEIAFFITLVWDDQEYSDSEAASLTWWAASNFLPSVPRGISGHQVGVNLGVLLNRTTLQFAALKFAALSDLPRASLGMCTFSKALGINDSELFDAISEARDAFH